VSLVGDALRKARREAAEREVEQRGVLYSAKISDQPARSHLGLGLALGALIAVTATVTGGALVWWLFVRGAQPQPAVGTAAPAADREESAAQIRSGGALDGDIDHPQQRNAALSGAASGAVPRSKAAAGATSSGSEDPAVDPAPAPIVERAAGRGSEPGDSEPLGQPEDRAPTSSRGGFTGIEDGVEVYILEADLGDVRLALDFLVHRTDDPFAEINGVEVHVGATIEGFRVVAIETDRVRLTDGRRDIVIRTP
jgi:hypothetical protein